MRELVAINTHEYYDIIWDVRQSEGFNYTNPEDVVAKVKEVWPSTVDCEYEVVGNEIYFLECNNPTVNPEGRSF
jgi:NADPH-dependent curcumin reductase CurA